jgi:DNA-binding NarL/FixJ family response regulator
MARLALIPHDQRIGLMLNAHSGVLPKPMKNHSMEVVLVEDSLRVRESVKQMLGEIPGVAVSGEFATAKAAIKGIDRLRPDLVILDIRLQNSNGLDVLKHVRAAHPGIEAYVFSDRAGADYQKHVSQLGTTHFFSKIGDAEKLYRAVAALSALARH